MTTSAAVLERIRDRLINDAERALVHAERYQVSKRQGERNSVSVYSSRI